MIVVGQATLIARTVPEATKKGRAQVCSVWWSEDLGLFRVYPLEMHWKLNAFKRYALRIQRNPKDSRHESWKILGPPELVDGHIDVARKEFIGRIDTMTAPCISHLNAKRASLAILDPPRIDLDWEYDKGTDPNMMRLFEDAQSTTTPTIGRNSYPHRPRIVFADEDGNHNLSLNEWGCYQGLSKPNFQTHDLRRALKIDQQDRQFRLLIGNQNHIRNSWLVIHLISWCEPQQSLFATPRHISASTRMDVFQKYGHRCCNCQSDSHLTIDHIKPKAHGGTNDIDNLQVLCRSCNSRKNDWPEEMQAAG
jgi:hypothetical protein